ncbi:hypothetical protein [Pedobacter sp. B4-66]|uniref:hypothetical protein n=1 Tax=Pedobacter sp. B4-66 TaxID=2817280 RepID=UPI001BDB6079|nr:hypothetical protein [Pedobacter sp. B4-66]
MKRKQLPILLLILFLGLSVQAQTKKQAGKKQSNKTIVQKKAARANPTAQVNETTQTVSTAQTKQTTESQSASTPEKAVKSVGAPAEEKGAKVNTSAKEEKVETSYKTALGLKFLWGIALTGKHFFKEKHAVEAIFKYRGYTGVGADIGLGVLYEYHNDIKGIEGLKWYAGGGVYAGTFSFKDEISDYMDQYGEGSNFYFGLAGVLGLEYKIGSLPIAISADWQPSFQLKDTYGSSGFSAESGGLGVKYTF